MSKIKVAVRVRPLSKKEVDGNSKFIVDIQGDTISVTNTKVESHGFGDSRERVKHFSYDYCYDSAAVPQSTAHASQQLVFQDLGTEVLQAAFEGYNTCVLAYGQTNTGKTHTMMGSQEDPGLTPRICEGLFSHIDDIVGEKANFRIDISYLEIYNERVRDLLRPSLLKKNEKYTLKVREHPKEGPYVQDLSSHCVRDNQQIQELLDRGQENRTTASTYMHDYSSRSHAIVTINFTQAKLEDDLPHEIVSKIHLVDLAGSERADPSWSSDYKGRLKEGSNINKSLVTLGNVITALAEKSLLSWSTDNLGSTQSCHSSSGNEGRSSPSTSPKRRVPYIPYRDSVLTWLLKDSLGGNSKTIMIATVTPASAYYNETISTLRYAQRAKRIINKPMINEDPNVALIRELRREIEKLRTMLASAAQMEIQVNDIMYVLPALKTHDKETEIKGSLIAVQDSGTFIAEKLRENEDMANKLTQTWKDKWQETHDIIKESDLSIRGLKKRTSSMGVLIESQLPHLVGMDDDILSTAVTIYHLKEGKTLIGRDDAEREQDIVISGPSVQKEHCFIKNYMGTVTLYINRGAQVTVNGIDCKGPTRLTQGDYILFGKTNMFRFNNPAEAAKLRERRESQEGLLSNASSLSSINTEDSDNMFLRVPRSLPYGFNQQLERRFDSEAERIEEAKRELEALSEDQDQTEDLRNESEEALWLSREKQRAEIEEQKQVLTKLVEEVHLQKQKAEDEIAYKRECLQKEKEAFQALLQEELDKIKEQELNEQLARQTGSDVLVVEASGKNDEISQEQVNQAIQQRKLTLEGHIKDLSQGELLKRFSYRRIEQDFVKHEEELEDQIEQSQIEIDSRVLKLKQLEEKYNAEDADLYKSITDKAKHLEEIQQRKEQLELYIEEKQDLLSVGSDRPRPLRTACSEEVLTDIQFLETGFPLRTTSLRTLQRGSEGDLPSVSQRFSMASRLNVTSMDSIQSGSVENMDVTTESQADDNSEISGDNNQKKTIKSAKISSAAKRVTDRLYNPPPPKFKREAKEKKSPVGKTSKDLKGKKDVKKDDSSDDRARRSSTPRRSPLREQTANLSKSPAKIKNAATTGEKKTEVKPKTAKSATLSSSWPTSSTISKSKKSDSSQKTKSLPTTPSSAHVRRSVTPPGLVDAQASKELGLGLDKNRRSAASSPDLRQLSRSPVPADRSGKIFLSRMPATKLRHMASTPSLASVPEAVGEEGDTMEPTTPESVTPHVVVKRRNRRHIEGEQYKRHSAPVGEILADAIQKYTLAWGDSMAEQQSGNTFSDNVEPAKSLKWTSVNIDIDDNMLTDKGHSDNVSVSGTGVSTSSTGVTPSDSEVSVSGTGVSTSSTGVTPSDSEVSVSDTGVSTSCTGVTPSDTEESVSGTGVLVSSTDVSSLGKDEICNEVVNSGTDVSSSSKGKIHSEVVNQTCSSNDQVKHTEENTETSYTLRYNTQIIDNVPAVTMSEECVAMEVENSGLECDVITVSHNIDALPVTVTPLNSNSGGFLENIESSCTDERSSEVNMDVNIDSEKSKIKYSDKVYQDLDQTRSDMKFENSVPKLQTSDHINESDVKNEEMEYQLDSVSTGSSLNKFNQVMVVSLKGTESKSYVQPSEEMQKFDNISVENLESHPESCVISEIDTIQSQQLITRSETHLDGNIVTDDLDSHSGNPDLLPQVLTSGENLSDTILDREVDNNLVSGVAVEYLEQDDNDIDEVDGDIYDPVHLMVGNKRDHGLVGGDSSDIPPKYHKGDNHTESTTALMDQSHENVLATEQEVVSQLIHPHHIDFIETSHFGDSQGILHGVSSKEDIIICENIENVITEDITENEGIINDIDERYSSDSLDSGSELKVKRRKSCDNVSSDSLNVSDNDAVLGAREQYALKEKDNENSKDSNTNDMSSLHGNATTPPKSSDLKQQNSDTVDENKEHMDTKQTPFLSISEHHKPSVNSPVSECLVITGDIENQTEHVVSADSALVTDTSEMAEEVCKQQTLLQESTNSNAAVITYTTEIAEVICEDSRRTLGTCTSPDFMFVEGSLCEVEDSQQTDDSLQEVQEQLQVLQEALDQKSPRGSNGNNAQLSSARKAVRQRAVIRQKQRGCSEESDDISQLSDDSITSENQPKPSSRPESGSRRRRRTNVKSSDRKAKRPKGLSSEEYITSESDGIYSDDSLTGQVKFYISDDPTFDQYGDKNKDVTEISSENIHSEVDLISETTDDEAKVTVEVTGCFLSNQNMDRRKANGFGGSGEVLEEKVVKMNEMDNKEEPHSRSSSETRSVQTDISLLGNGHFTAPSMSSNSDGSYSDLAVSPLSVWSSGDKKTQYHQPHSKGSKAKSEKCVKKHKHVKQENLAVSPTDSWSTEILGPSTSKTRSASNTDSYSSFVMETETLSPQLPSPSDRFIQEGPSVSQSPPNLGTTFPVVYEVTVKEDHTNVFYNVERTEIKTYGLRSQIRNNDSMTIPESININLQETNTNTTEKRSETVYKEEVRFHNLEEQTSPVDSVISERTFRSVSDISVESPGSRQEKRVEQHRETEDSNSYIDSQIVAAQNSHQEAISKPDSLLSPRESDTTSDYGTLVDVKLGTSSCMSGSQSTIPGDLEYSPFDDSVFQKSLDESEQNEFSFGAGEYTENNVDVQVGVNNISQSPEENLKTIEREGHGLCSTEETGASNLRPGVSHVLRSPELISNVILDDSDDKNVSPSIKNMDNDIVSNEPGSGLMENHSSSESEINVEYSEYDMTVPVEYIQDIQKNEEDASKLNNENNSKENENEKHERINSVSSESVEYATPTQYLSEENIERVEVTTVNLNLQRENEQNDIKLMQGYDQQNEINIKDNLSVLKPTFSSLSPQRSLKTVSVNTEEELNRKPEKTVDRSFREDLKQELQHKLARLQRRVRSLSDSAISSDFTDGDSTSASPRGSRLYESDKVLRSSGGFGGTPGLKIPMTTDIEVMTTQAESRYEQCRTLPFMSTTKSLDIDNKAVKKSPFQDSGNVFDDENNDSEIITEYVEETDINESENLNGAESKINSDESETHEGTCFENQNFVNLESSDNLSSESEEVYYEERSLSPGEIWLNPNVVTSDELYQTFASGLLTQDETGAMENQFNRLPVDSNVQHISYKEKSPSLSDLNENKETEDYRRSLSENCIDQYEERTNSSNESIVFVFMGQSHSKASMEQLNNLSTSQQEFMLDKYEKEKSVDESMDITNDLSKSTGDENELENSNGEEQNSTNGTMLISESDKSMETPLRHRYGIDSNVLPIPERSISSDNLPKSSASLPNIHRSRSADMLDVGVIEDPTGNEGVFPPCFNGDSSVSADEQVTSLDSVQSKKLTDNFSNSKTKEDKRQIEVNSIRKTDQNVMNASQADSNNSEEQTAQQGNVLPALGADNRAQSMTVIGSVPKPTKLVLSDETEDWYNVSHRVLESDSILKNIKQHVPGMSANTTVDDSQADNFVTADVPRIPASTTGADSQAGNFTAGVSPENRDDSTQTGGSLTDLQSFGIQTDELFDLDDQKHESCASTTQTGSGLVTPLEICDIESTDYLPEKPPKTGHDTAVQTNTNFTREKSAQTYERGPSDSIESRFTSSTYERLPQYGRQNVGTYDTNSASKLRHNNQSNNFITSTTEVRQHQHDWQHHKIEIQEPEEKTETIVYDIPLTPGTSSRSRLGPKGLHDSFEKNTSEVRQSRHDLQHHKIESQEPEEKIVTETRVYDLSRTPAYSDTSSTSRFRHDNLPNKYTTEVKQHQHDWQHHKIETQEPEEIVTETIVYDLPQTPNHSETNSASRSRHYDLPIKSTTEIRQHQHDWQHHKVKMEKPEEIVTETIVYDVPMAPVVTEEKIEERQKHRRSSQADDKIVVTEREFRVATEVELPDLETSNAEMEALKAEHNKMMSTLQKAAENRKERTKVIKVNRKYSSISQDELEAVKKELEKEVPKSEKYDETYTRPLTQREIEIIMREMREETENEAKQIEREERSKKLMNMEKSKTSSDSEITNRISYLDKFSSNTDDSYTIKNKDLSSKSRSDSKSNDTTNNEPYRCTSTWTYDRNKSAGSDSTREINLAQEENQILSYSHTVPSKTETSKENKDKKADGGVDKPLSDGAILNRKIMSGFVDQDFKPTADKRQKIKSYYQIGRSGIDENVMPVYREDIEDVMSDTIGTPTCGTPPNSPLIQSEETFATFTINQSSEVPISSCKHNEKGDKFELYQSRGESNIPVGKNTSTVSPDRYIYKSRHVTSVEQSDKKRGDPTIVYSSALEGLNAPSKTDGSNSVESSSRQERDSSKIPENKTDSKYFSSVYETMYSDSLIPKGGVINSELSKTERNDETDSQGTIKLYTPKNKRISDRSIEIKTEVKPEEATLPKDTRNIETSTSVYEYNIPKEYSSKYSSLTYTSDSTELADGSTSVPSMHSRKIPVITDASTEVKRKYKSDNPRDTSVETPVDRKTKDVSVDISKDYSSDLSSKYYRGPFSSLSREITSSVDSRKSHVSQDFVKGNKVSTGVEVCVDSSDDFTQTDLRLDLTGLTKENASKSVMTSDKIKTDLERLQKERVEIIELLSLNYLPASLTIELLERKLNYCIGQTDLLLESLEDNLDYEIEELNINTSYGTKEYISKYKEDLKQSKRDIEICRERMERKMGKGRGRTIGRNRDLCRLRRNAEIEAFKAERCIEQLKHNQEISVNPLKNLSASLHARYDRGVRSASPSSTSSTPRTMTPKQHRDHLVELRRQLVKATKDEDYRNFRERNCRSSSPRLMHSDRSHYFSPTYRYLHKTRDSRSLSLSPHKEDPIDHQTDVSYGISPYVAPPPYSASPREPRSYSFDSSSYDMQRYDRSSSPFGANYNNVHSHRYHSSDSMKGYNSHTYNQVSFSRDGSPQYDSANSSFIDDANRFNSVDTARRMESPIHYSSGILSDTRHVSLETNYEVGHSQKNSYKNTRPHSVDTFSRFDSDRYRYLSPPSRDKSPLSVQKPGAILRSDTSKSQSLDTTRRMFDSQNYSSFSSGRKEDLDSSLSNKTRRWYNDDTEQLLKEIKEMKQQNQQEISRARDTLSSYRQESKVNDDSNFDRSIDTSGSSDSQKRYPGRHDRSYSSYRDYATDVLRSSQQNYSNMSGSYELYEGGSPRHLIGRQSPTSSLMSEDLESLTDSVHSGSYYTFSQDYENKFKSTRPVRSSDLKSSLFRRKKLT